LFFAELPDEYFTNGVDLVKRWLRRRRLWFMSSGDGWPSAWRWTATAILGLTIGALSAVIYLQHQQLTLLETSTVADFEALKKEHVQLQNELATAEGENKVLQETLAAQKDIFEKAQLLTNTAQSQRLADNAMLAELSDQLRQLEAENEQLKTDLGFFETMIPNSQGSSRQRVKTVTAVRVGPTELAWRALVVQARKNADEFSGELVFVVKGRLFGKPWELSTSASPTPVTLVQYLQLDGVIVVPAALEVQTLTAQLRRADQLISSTTIKVPSNP
jgi:DNA gyrase/topoisomerase IV subunit A